MDQSFSLFLPTIIKSLGYSSVNAQLLTVPPNFGAFLLVLATAALSDRIKARGPIMIAGCVLAIAGYIMLLAAKKPAVRYGGTFLVASGVYPGSPMFVSRVARSRFDSLTNFVKGDGLVVKQPSPALRTCYWSGFPDRPCKLCGICCNFLVSHKGCVSHELCQPSLVLAC